MNAIRCTAAVVGVGVLVLMMAGVGVAQSAATLTAAKPESLAVGNKMYDAEKELARLAKRYGLTADQKTKIQPILLGQQKRVHALGEDEALSDAEWAGEVRKVHLQTVAEVKRQLTDEQATKYAKDEAKRVKSIGQRVERWGRWTSEWAAPGWRAWWWRTGQVVGRVGAGLRASDAGCQGMWVALD